MCYVVGSVVGRVHRPDFISDESKHYRLRCMQFDFSKKDVQDHPRHSHTDIRRNYARHTPVYGRSSRFYVVGTGAFAGSQRGGVSRGAADIPATAATAAAAAAAAAAADLAAGSVCAPTPTIVGARNGRGTPTRRSVQRRTSPLAAQRCEPVRPVRVHRAYHHAPARTQV